MPAPAPPDQNVRVLYLGWIRASIAAGVIFLVALLIAETFVLDTFVIFTSSMEPTVAGRASGGDRILVSNLHYQIEDPSRWEVILFIYGNNRSTRYMKRLVGLGGEQIMILGGDLYRAAADFIGDPIAGVRSGEVTILRKPAWLLESLLPTLPVPFSRGQEPFSDGQLWMNFEMPETTADLWHAENGQVQLTGSSMLDCRITPMDTLYDCISHRPAGSAGTVVGEGRHPTGDLSFRLTVLADDNGGTVVLVIHDPSHGDPVTARIGVGPGTKCSLSLGDQVLGTAPGSLLPGVWTQIRLDNIDDEAILRIGGEEVLRRPYTHDPIVNDEDHSWGRGGISFGGENGLFRFQTPAMLRDLYYVQEGQIRFLVPQGQFLFLGDNSLTSADSRRWQRTAILERRTGSILEGDSLGVTRDGIIPPGRNPWMNPDGTWVFVDTAGTRHLFEAENEFTALGSWATPYVPRSDIVGRGFAIIGLSGRAGALR